MLSMLMAALWARGRARQAIEIYHAVYSTLKRDADRAEVTAFAMTIRAFSYDDAGVDAEHERLLQLQSSASNYSIAASHAALAVVHSYHGDHARASQEMDVALAGADPARRQNDTLAFQRLLIDFRAKGCQAAEDRLPSWLASNRIAGRNHDFGATFLAWVSVAKGEWDRALTLVEESLLTDITAAARISQLTICAMIGCLSGEAPAQSAQLQSMYGELRAWQSNDALLQLAPWYLLTTPDQKLERDLEAAVPTLFEHPPSLIALGFVPFGLALWAHRFEKIEWLQLMANTECLKDTSAWAAMQWKLARGLALQLLGNEAAGRVLRVAADAARGLGADFFAGYASFRCGAATPGDLELLRRLRISDLGREPHRPAHGLTPREMEVARLVGDGKSNRAIAEELVLSERTIERHLGNIFDKLQLESRAKLMRWLFEHDSQTITR